jgi:hypothetical protein
MAMLMTITTPAIFLRRSERGAEAPLYPDHAKAENVLVQYSQHKAAIGAACRCTHRRRLKDG